MIRNSTAPAEARTVASAVVIDFEAQKTLRLQQRLAAAAPAAALVLTRLEAGLGEWRDLALALITPFNP
jgi:hypothetical protein